MPYADLEVIEDESGKWIHPRWYIENPHSGTIVAGPFDSEEAAADWLADELDKENRGP